MSEPIKVIIENLPSENYLETWIPIIIAILSFIISLITVYFTISSFRKNTRPFIYAQNFAFLDNQNTIQNQNNSIMFMLVNSPANILYQKVEYIIKKGNKENVLFQDERRNFIQYPNNQSQWWFSLSITDYEKYRKGINEDEKLLRRIVFKYKSLAGGKKYNYEFIQEFEQKRDLWKDIKINAN